MNEPIPETRRDRRILARKAHILDAASRLFAEKGFHRTTTRDIAVGADISEGTLYNYFENKDELLMGIVTHLAKVQDLEGTLDRAVTVDAGRFLSALLRSQKDFIEDNNAMLKAVLSEILVNPALRVRYYRELILPLTNKIQDHLQRRIELGQLKPLDAALAARVLVGMTTGLFILDVLDDPLVHGSWEQLTEVLTGMLFESIRSE